MQASYQWASSSSKQCEGTYKMPAEENLEEPKDSSNQPLLTIFTFAEWEGGAASTEIIKSIITIVKM